MSNPIIDGGCAWQVGAEHEPSPPPLASLMEVFETFLTKKKKNGTNPLVLAQGRATISPHMSKHGVGPLATQAPVCLYIPAQFLVPSPIPQS